ncbi:four-carbon acid sugar kinase family protein, partial [Burkholderia multivorans]
AQLATLSEDPSVCVVRTVLDGEGLPDVEATLARIGSVTSAKAVIVATVTEASDVVDLTDAAAEETTRRLAEIAGIVMEAPEVTGLYTTGGDVTAAVMSAVGAGGKEIEKEIIPPAVGGRLARSRAHGKPIL